MEVIEAIAKLISEHGIITVLSAIGLGGLIWKGKSLATWFVQTLQAPETVRMLQESNIELRAQLDAMQRQLEENNRVILDQATKIASLSTEIAILREMAKSSTKSRVKRLKNIDNEAE